MSKYELLAPVGNFANLKAAIDGGADAVYFGIKGFNMREGAKNFTLKDLPKIKKICLASERKVKRYLTVNTIIYDDEIKKVEKILRTAKNSVDAIICWDFSVIELCRKLKIPFHISTQASIANSASAKFFKKLGAERAVLARELSLKKIKPISKIMKVECFAHGAMCVAVSGRCFASQFVHCTSANRGECAHPCRRAWIVKDEDGHELKLENNRVMSAKDLCTLPFLEEMKKAGVTSFKIEGRNRSPEYVYTVTKIYRRALDKKLSSQELKDGIEELKKVYNRGFSSGFYFKMPTADDFSCSENGEQLERKELIGRIEKYWPKAKVASVKLFTGKIKVGDEIYVIGNDVGVKRLKIERLEQENKSVQSAEKGEEVGVKISDVKKGDEVYLIRKSF